MRIFHPLCALVLAAAAPAALLAQDSAPSGAAPTTTAAAKKEPVKKKPVKRAGPPAKVLFGAAKTPAPLAARAIGFYAKGCLAGAAALPIDGPAWQAMRLSRNRNWGHPELVGLVEKLAIEAKAHDGWPGLLVGDLSQPRGGPMLTGHASHQVGLDADIWLTPMPDRRLTEKEREDLSATSMLAADKVSVDPRDLEARARAPDQARRLLHSGGAHLRAPRHQEGAVRGHRQGQRSRVAAQGAADVGPPLSFPRPHRLPARQRQLRAPARARQRGWLRRRAGALDRPDEAARAKPAGPPGSRPSPASRSISCPANAGPCWRAAIRARRLRLRRPRSLPRRPRRPCRRNQPTSRRRRPKRNSRLAPAILDRSCLCGLGSGDFHADADGTGEAGAAEPAVAVRHLRQVLLVIVLGEVELRRVDDLGRDRPVAVGASAPSGRRPWRPPPPAAAPGSSRRCRSGTACRRRCPGACPASGRGSPRTS